MKVWLFVGHLTLTLNGTDMPTMDVASGDHVAFRSERACMKVASQFPPYFNSKAENGLIYRFKIGCTMIDVRPK